MGTLGDWPVEPTGCSPRASSHAATPPGRGASSPSALSPAPKGLARPSRTVVTTCAPSSPRKRSSLASVSWESCQRVTTANLCVNLSSTKSILRRVSLYRAVSTTAKRMCRNTLRHPLYFTGSVTTRTWRLTTGSALPTTSTIRTRGSSGVRGRPTTAPRRGGASRRPPAMHRSTVAVLVRALI
jgi:hypothetical protein